MATSGSVDFTVTRDDIIELALEEVGVFDPGAGIDTTHKTTCARRLNVMVKSWNVKPKLYTNETFEITLTPGTESYTIGSGGTFNRNRPVRVVSARRIDSNSIDTPIAVVSREEYFDLPVKNTQSPANMVYYDPQISLGRLYFWPTGDSNNTTISLTTQREIEDFDAASNNPDFPKEAFRALYLNLAVNIWRVFHPREEMPASLMIDAQNALRDWEDHEEEDSFVTIVPTDRGY